MYKYKKDIYELCTNTIRKTFSLFCDEINNSKAEVFVVMAHKAVLLFKVLLEQNHISPVTLANKIVISNQALDFECSYLQGKRIAIIDDIVISGTSIATVVDQLLKKGVSQCDISIIALATDKNYLAMSFDNCDDKSSLKCNTVLEDDTCIELSSYISKIFAYYGMPYNIDFPTYKAIKLDGEKVNLLYNNFLWQTNKIDTINRNDSNVNSYILFPSKIIRKMLWNRIGVNLNKCVHLKLRMYTIQYANGKKEGHILPLCLFNGITEKNLCQLYELFKPEEKELTLNEDNIYVAKMRYVQFYLAHQLYIIFNKVTSLCEDEKPIKNSIHLLFGLYDGIKIYNTINDIRKNESSIIEITDTNYINDYLLNKYSESDIAKEIQNSIIEHKNLKKECGFLINKILLSPFLWWYDTKEIPVREELTKNPKHYIRDLEEIKKMINRLNSGFSLATLRSILKKIDCDSVTVISLFLDRAIDEGIIVPTIYHDKNERFLCRVYRHGEDLPFGIADECRLLFFIKELSRFIPNIDCSINNINIEGIAQISLEKMIVLFYQMGIKRGNIFNHFLGFDNIKLLKTFLSLHGAIEGVIDPMEMNNQKIKEHIYSEKDETGRQYITWLTNWLASNNFIKEKEINKKFIYVVNKSFIEENLIQNERSCMSDLIKGEITNIANMISVWYNSLAKMNAKNRFKKDATALTSCSNVFVYSSAIATEIHYFSKFWKSQVIDILNDSCDINELIRNLINQEKVWTLNIEQALNSGRNKVEWFNSGKASKVVSEVSKILFNYGANIWSELWDDVRSAQYKASYSLQNYIDQAVGFLYFYSACYDCLINRSFWESGTFPPKYEEYKRIYTEKCKNTDLLENDLFEKLEKINSFSDFLPKKLELNNLIIHSLKNSEDTVHNIELEIENNSPNYTVQYKASLIFDVNSINSLIEDELVMKVWDQLKDNNLKTQINIIKFPSSLVDNGFTRFGFFYDISSRNSNSNPLHNGEILINLYNRLCEVFNGRVYQVKAIMLPDTPPGRMFKHNVQRNIAKYAMKFNSDIIEPLKKYFIDKTNQQLVLAVTDYVDLEIYKKMDKMGWDKNVKFLQMSDEIFSDITNYYNCYIYPERTENSDVTYSIVKIQCNNKWGTGFLLRIADKVVCITCNHILSVDNRSEILAISSYSTKKEFPIIPIKDIISCDYNNNVLEAEDEVAILLPKWGGRIPFDINYILSWEDLKKESGIKTNINCSCCGYINYETLDYSWSDNMQTGKRVAKGYYETMINNSENSVKAGFSGGIITLNNDLNKIIGIHEGRICNNRGRMIPCSKIIAAIEKGL